MWLPTKDAAELEGCSERTLRWRVANGIYHYREVRCRGGKNGTKYEIHFESLSSTAKFRYFQRQLGEPDVEMKIEHVPQWQLDEAMRRRCFVERALDIKRGRDYIGKRTEELQRLAAEAGVSLATLNRWVAAWREKLLAGLLPQWGKTRGRPLSIAPEVQDLIKSAYLRQQKPPVEHVYKRVERYCKRHDIRIPSYRAVLRFVRSLPESVETYHREGEKAWKQASEPIVRRDFSDLAVNEIWCGDHREFDLFVYVSAKNRKQIRRPWLTAWMDMRSRRLVGWCISFQPESQTIALALRHGILNCGKPDHVYIDNGKDYQADRFGKRRKLGKIDFNTETLGTLGMLGVRTVNAIPYSARSKPIERFFRNIAMKFERYLPGWCGRDNKERPEKLKAEIEQQELLTIDELRQAFAKFIAEEYNCAVHSELGCAPDDLYAGATVHTIPEHQLNFLLMKRVEKTLFNDGIHMNGVRYRNLALVQQVFINDKVDVYYDPADMSRILVYNRRDEKFVGWVPIEAAMSMHASEKDFEYAAKLRKAARQKIRDWSKSWQHVHSRRAALEDAVKARQNPEPAEQQPVKTGRVVPLMPIQAARAEKLMRERAADLARPAREEEDEDIQRFRKWLAEEDERMKKTGTDELPLLFPEVMDPQDD